MAPELERRRCRAEITHNFSSTRRVPVGQVVCWWLQRAKLPFNCYESNNTELHSAAPAAAVVFLHGNRNGQFRLFFFLRQGQCERQGLLFAEKVKWFANEVILLFSMRVLFGAYAKEILRERLN